MTLQMLTIGKREFVLLTRRDFERLAAQAERQSEDEYWTDAALQAEAKARAKREKPIPFEQVEQELDAKKPRASRFATAEAAMKRGAWSIELLPSARRELLALRGPIQDRVRAAIQTLADDPVPSDSIPMRGKGVGLHRLRVGSHRVMYRLQSERVCVLVIRIGHRAEVYRGWEDM